MSRSNEPLFQGSKTRSTTGSATRSATGSTTGSALLGGSDFLQLDPDRAPAGGRTEWLAGRLRAAIADGTLPVGTRLPASRVLAAELGVSRGLVTEAYQRLAAPAPGAGGRRGRHQGASGPPPAPAPRPRA
ncbi:GntR family transcriptional regulator, partial [Streptomyces goshikiensis]|uniref:GntR family transcriptional regulator n=1 Tax=Streptomyces goshikiensis TaxID=1942 RepID=UPI0036BA8214